MSTRGLVAKIALPYAEALIESARSMNLVQETTRDLDLISELLSESHGLRDFLTNPLIKPSAKKTVLQKVFSEQLNDHVFNFLYVLIDRRRIALLNSIIDSYLNLSYRLESTIIVNVSSAIALTDLQKTSLKRKVQDITDSKEVRLVISVNPELLAGLVIKIGSKIIDTSLFGQLNQMMSYLNLVSS
uniref:ATP synthase CF1 delta subunit n=1 Tax=Rhodogorgon sp. TaxID=2485824 RepID=A0A3G3MI64_9FLOR|nr:ATP synthase CF1 delta subunit [Rhodogorgon sp.]